LYSAQTVLPVRKLIAFFLARFLGPQGHEEEEERKKNRANEWDMKREGRKKGRERKHRTGQRKGSRTGSACDGERTILRPSVCNKSIRCCHKDVTATWRRVAFLWLRERQNQYYRFCCRKCRTIPPEHLPHWATAHPRKLSLRLQTSNLRPTVTST